MFDFDDLPPDLEVAQVEITSGVNAVVRRRPARNERAQIAAVLLPGNPSPQFGSSHASAPLLLAVDTALAKKGIPTLRFDFKGVGLSGPGGVYESDPKHWLLPRHEESMANSYAAVMWAKEHLSNNIVTIGYSYGASIAKDGATSGLFCAYIGLSMGYNVFKFLEGKAAIDAKASMEMHSMIPVPSLYVVGEKDRMTPLEQVKRLASARHDGGEGVAIEVISGGTHDFKGKEAMVGAKCTMWLDQLAKELANETLDSNTDPRPAEATSKETRVEPLGQLSSDASNFELEEDNDAADCEVFNADGKVLGIADMDGTIRGSCAASGCSGFRLPKGVEMRPSLGRVCRSCGQDVLMHENKGVIDILEEQFVHVHIMCERKPTAEESVSNAFHVRLLRESTVCSLRAALNPCLPPGAQVFGDSSVGRLPLLDDDLLPAKVVLPVFNGTITADMLLTKQQCREFQEELKEVLSDKEVQQKLDQLQFEVKGNEGKYRMKLASFLLKEVYPPLVPKYGIPVEMAPMLVSRALSAHSQDDIPMLEKWLVLETLMRHKKNMEMAQATMSAAKEKIKQMDDTLYRKTLGVN